MAWSMGPWQVINLWPPRTTTLVPALHLGKHLACKAERRSLSPPGNRNRHHSHTIVTVAACQCRARNQLSTPDSHADSDTHTTRLRATIKIRTHWIQTHRVNGHEKLEHGACWGLAVCFGVVYVSITTHSQGQLVRRGIAIRHSCQARGGARH